MEIFYRNPRLSALGSSKQMTLNLCEKRSFLYYNGLGQGEASAVSQWGFHDAGVLTALFPRHPQLWPILSIFHPQYIPNPCISPWPCYTTMIQDPMFSLASAPLTLTPHNHPPHTHTHFCCPSIHSFPGTQKELVKLQVRACRSWANPFLWLSGDFRWNQALKS